MTAQGNRSLYGRAVDFQLPPDDDPRRLAVRAWLHANPKSTPVALAEAGYVAPHWPAPYGLGADPVHQVIIDEELAAARVRRPNNPIGIGWAGPTLLYGGTEVQKLRYLPRLLSGEDFWCQLFSEPGSGSDLASLSTRARRDGDEFVVDGQKTWTSGAQFARYGILIARTDPHLPKHRGISYLICPMDLPGIEIRQITEITGGHTFNEVFFTDVRIPAENLVGDLNDGWRLAKVTLGNERVSLSTGGVLWGMGPTALQVLETLRADGPIIDPHIRQRLASVRTEHVLLDLIRLRTVSARLRGDQPGPEASVRKILADEHGQHVMAAARDLLAAAAMLTDDEWYDGFMFSQALTIGGGTGNVQRNIVAERVLGLPADVDEHSGMTWAAARAAGFHQRDSEK